MAIVITWVMTSDAKLIDAGISCRETEKRMKQLGLSLQKSAGDLCLA